MAEYIDREAAVNAVLNLVPKVDDDGYCWVIRGDAARAIDSIPAADAIEELSKPRWISVEERLPEEDEVVLVWGGASVYTAKRHNKYGAPMWWKLNSKRHYCNPTHWMPLPEPPKEESNGV